jgi:SAM-dependent methyltransferase
LDRYSIRSSYTSRAEPSYFDDAIDNVVWQPDVYADVGRIAAFLGAKRVIDVGAGDGSKLAALHPGVEVIGIDFGANVERSQANFPFGSWRTCDLDTEEPLPVTDEELSGSIVVSSDVIEHLKRPELLLARLVAALDQAGAIIISTPERDLTRGPRTAGPPRNEHHVREWSILEFGELLREHGFRHVVAGLTRSNDRTEEPHTIEVVAAPTDDVLRKLVPLLIERPLPEARRPLYARILRAARVLRYG